MRRLDRAGLRDLGLCLASGGALGCAYMFGFARLAGIAAPLGGASGASALLRAAASSLVVHALIGVPLSLFWRRSGNLAVPAFAHAFVDAFRNVLFGT